MKRVPVSAKLHQHSCRIQNTVLHYFSQLSGWLLNVATQVRPVLFLVDKLTMGQVYCGPFGCSCQYYSSAVPQSIMHHLGDGHWAR